MVIQPQTRAALVSRLFAAALDPSRWQDALDALSAELDGAKLHLFGHDTRQRIALGTLFSGHDPAWTAGYAETYGAMNPYPAMAGPGHAHRPLDLDSLVPRQALFRTDFYGAFMAPQENLTGGTGLILDFSPAALFVIGTLHPERHRERLDAHALAALDDLKDSLTAAWSLSRTVGARAFEHAVARETPGTGGMLLVLDEAGRAVFMDAAAEAQVEAGRWVRRAANGRAVFVDEAFDARVGDLRAAVARGGERCDGFVSTSRFDGQTVACHVAPIEPEAMIDWHGAFVLGLVRPCVLVAMTPLAPRVSVAERLVAEHGLTAAEAEVAHALCGGATPAEIAETRGVSLYTVRNQIKAAMLKCGVSRQSQLVALIAGF